jgi:hypothetical protein
MEIILFEVLRKIWKLIPFAIRKKRILLAAASKIVHLHNTLDARKLFDKSSELTETEIAQFRNSINFISWPTYDWNIPLKQRPQHIAENLAMIDGVQYIFCTKNYYDSLVGVRRLSKNLYLVKNFWKYAKLCTHVHVYATDPTLTLRLFKRIEKMKKPIFYEILDEIHEDLQGKVSKSVVTRHSYALASKQVTKIIITAKNMENKLPGNARAKLCYIPNACDANHFRMQEIPSEKRVVGYFGALASWVDYELISFLAKRNPDWTINLIGMDYDGSIWKSGILSQENVRYLGAVDYQNLPSEIQFTVAILPFKVNDITISTSPIKIYEYLSSGFPVVSTPLPECEAISHVSIGIGYEDFEEKIKSAIVVDGTKNRIERRSFAIEQSWKARAAAYVAATIDKEENKWQK